MDACPRWPNQSAHARRPLIATQRRAPNDLSALAACQLQTSSCRAFTLKGRDGAGCCCSWRTRPASGSLPRPAESDRSDWWVHPGALGSRTSGCGQILDKEALACWVNMSADRRGWWLVVETVICALEQGTSPEGWYPLDNLPTLRASTGAAWAPNPLVCNDPERLARANPRLDSLIYFGKVSAY